jgi:hypothetical protein
MDPDFHRDDEQALVVFIGATKELTLLGRSIPDGEVAARLIGLMPCVWRVIRYLLLCSSRTIR